MKKETKNSTWKQKLYSSHALTSKVKDIFRNAREYRKPHHAILNRLREEVYERQMYLTLPMYMRSEINGYIKAHFEIMYEYVEWVHWYDGKFVGKDLPYGNNFNQDLVKSAHVYKGTENIY